MSEYVIWRHREGLTLYGRDEKIEVRYAVPPERSRHLESVLPDEDISHWVDVPIKVPRNLFTDTEDLPEKFWHDGGSIPAKVLLDLYKPEVKEV